jgi:hypothetical protein
MEVPRTYTNNDNCVQRGGLVKTFVGWHPPKIYVQHDKWGNVFVYL